MIKDFAFDYENNHIAILSNLGSLFLYDMKILIQFYKYL